MKLSERYEDGPDTVTRAIPAHLQPRFADAETDLVGGRYLAYIFPVWIAAGTDGDDEAFGATASEAIAAYTKGAGFEPATVEMYAMDAEDGEWMVYNEAVKIDGEWEVVK